MALDVVSLVMVLRELEIDIFVMLVPWSPAQAMSGHAFMFFRVWLQMRKMHLHSPSFLWASIGINWHQWPTMGKLVLQRIFRKTTRALRGLLQFPFLLSLVFARVVLNFNCYHPHSMNKATTKYSSMTRALQDNVSQDLPGGMVQ